jgi:phosphoglycolate phosphatase
MLIKERNIFWDWNGTLLNDTYISLSIMNTMLGNRSMKLLNLEYYKEVFGFPVIEYYKKLGFDFNNESFETLSLEFIENYSVQMPSASLALDSELILKNFTDKGKNNIILSAMQRDMLVDLVIQTGLKGYFSEILGIENIYAHSKSAVAMEYIKKNKIPVDDILLIGDTLHDFEVANDIGCRCILITHGHQSEKRLIDSGACVIDSFSQLIQK